VKEISRELYPREWNLSDNEEDNENLANTQIFEQTGVGEEENQPQVPNVDMIVEEEVKDNENNI
jgi:hypothetical protein